MNSKTEDREKKICQIRQRIKEESYLTNEVVTRIAEKILQDVNAIGAKTV